MSDRTTIFALASGQGRAGVAIVRLSGPQAFAVVERLSRRAHPEPRRAALRALHDPETGELLDQALVLCFAAPASLTGEDVAEFHIHGGRAVLAGLLGSLSRLPGLAPAGPGDFSRRAFDNGRLDLTAAEALSDLVMAETAAQRRLALMQAGGALYDLYEDWRHRLLSVLGRIEAAIDFAEEDLPGDLFGRAVGEVGALLSDLRRHLDDGHRGERVRDGISIVLTGPPNSGKSSLLNALAKRDAAIVSDIPGTTRDTIELLFDLGGYAVTLVDTAGIREAGDAIEAEGVRRALKRAENADLRLRLVAMSDIGKIATDPARDILVVTKADLHPEWTPGAVDDGKSAFIVSAVTGAGLPALLQTLTDRVIATCDIGDAPALTRVRHRQALETCRDLLESFGRMAAVDPVLATEDVRLAVRALGGITGRVDIEDMLNIVFAEFCIGK